MLLHLCLFRVWLHPFGRSGCNSYTGCWGIWQSGAGTVHVWQEQNVCTQVPQEAAYCWDTAARACVQREEHHVELPQPLHLQVHLFSCVTSIWLTLLHILLIQTQPTLGPDDNLLLEICYIMTLNQFQNEMKW